MKRLLKKSKSQKVKMICSGKVKNEFGKVGKGKDSGRSKEKDK